MVAHSPVPAPSFADLWRICKRHAVVALGVAVLIAVGVWWGASTIVPIYRANATLALDRGAKPVFQGDRDPVTEQSLLNSQRDFLLATPTLAQAVQSDAFRMSAPYAGHADPVGVLRQRLDLTVSRDSSAISVSLRDEHPDQATVLLRSVVATFLERLQDQRVQRINQSLSLLERQVVEARTKLEECRENERVFRAKNAIISTDPDGNYVAVRLRQTNGARSEIATQLASGDALDHQLAEARAQSDREARLQSLLRIDAVNHDPTVIAISRVVGEIKDRELLLSQRYLDKYPRLKETREQLAAKRIELQRAVDDAGQALDKKQEKLRIQVAAIDEQVVKQEESLRIYRNNLFSLQVLGQETASHEKFFLQLQGRLNEERVTSQLQASTMSVIEPPRADPQAINIRPTATIAVALGLAVLGGLLAALAKHALASRVHGGDEAAEITGLPMIGRIPYVKGLNPVTRSGNHEQHSELAEGFRGLRTAISLLLNRPGCAVLAVCSSDSMEGKTSVCTHLAISLAATGARVLLVDADLRNPHLQFALGETATVGLETLLVAPSGTVGDFAIPATVHKGLNLMGVGQRPANPAELLHSRILPEAMAEWRKRFHYIIIDTPPLGPVLDALVVANLSDVVLVVVRDRVTLKAELVRTIATLSPLIDKVTMGMVMNCERGKRSKYGYPYLYSTAANHAALAGKS